MTLIEGAPLVDPGGDRARVRERPRWSPTPTASDRRPTEPCYRLDAETDALGPLASGAPLQDPWGVAVEAAGRIVVTDVSAGGGGLFAVDPASGCGRPDRHRGAVRGTGRRRADPPTGPRWSPTSSAGAVYAHGPRPAAPSARSPRALRSSPRAAVLVEPELCGGTRADPARLEPGTTGSPGPGATTWSPGWPATTCSAASTATTCSAVATATTGSTRARALTRSTADRGSDRLNGSTGPDLVIGGAGKRPLQRRQRQARPPARLREADLGSP